MVTTSRATMFLTGVVVGSRGARGASKRDVCIHIPRREICEGLFFVLLGAE